MPETAIVVGHLREMFSKVAKRSIWPQGQIDLILGPEVKVQGHCDHVHR